MSKYNYDKKALKGLGVGAFLGLVKERKDFFVKPPIEIPTHIKEKTNISSSDVENARTFKECVKEILELNNKGKLNKKAEENINNCKHDLKIIQKQLDKKLEDIKLDKNNSQIFTAYAKEDL